MAHEAHAPRDARTGAPGAPEDEDLFDFPVIEMTLEVAPPAAPFAQAAQAPRPQPAHAYATSTDLPGPTYTPPPGTTVADGAEPLDEASDGDVQRAAELIEGLESVLDGPDGTQILGRPPRGKRSRVVATSGSPIGLLAGMLLLNLLTFAFFWHVSRTFRDGIEALRGDVLLASKNATPPESVQAAPEPPAPAVQAPAPEPTQETAPPETSTAEPAKRTATPPGIPFERTTLDLAAQEIHAGETLSARKRLHRLLAMVDRVEPELRADVEARARYMVADSYAEQAAHKIRELGDRTPGASGAAVAGVEGGGH